MVNKIILTLEGSLKNLNNSFWGTVERVESYIFTLIVMIKILSRKIFKSAYRLAHNQYLFADLPIFLLTPIIALLFRLDGNIYQVNEQLYSLFIATILFTVIKFSILIASGWYRRNWQYPNISELSYIAQTFTIVAVLNFTLFQSLRLVDNLPLQNLPLSLPLLDTLFSAIAIVTLRLILSNLDHKSDKANEVPLTSVRVLVVGAGNAGTSIVRQMQLSPQLGLKPVAFIDDNSRKIHSHIYGLPVLGSRHKISSIVSSRNIDKVIIAMPSASGKSIRKIVDICQSHNIPVSTIPSLEEILNAKSEAKVENVRDIQIEDLLRRDPIKTDFDKVTDFIKGKRVLVTGAGGSIGSEICRQILRFAPSEIVLLGKSENSIFLIQQELEKTLYKMKVAEDCKLPCLKAFICDIRNLGRLEYIFNSFKPDVIFHAAAHKHVPLMELNAPEAISTNVFGTRNLVSLALRFEVENFVMISTDKAVNPTNIMGASKRVAEMSVLQAAKTSKKPYTVVRFGNVLGSRGSVVPTFKRQIAEGGPVTITHPDIIRYFMTIPEAVQLVLQTAVLGRGGEVCMLDMGEPIKILDLAKDLIHLSGYEVGKDIDIIYTGLRPGEKLFEELFIPGEKYEQTEHEKIRVVRNASECLPTQLNATIEELGKAAVRNDSQAISNLLEKIVLGYTRSPYIQDFQAIQVEEKSFSTIEALERLYHGSHSQGDYVAKPNFLESELQSALENQQFTLFYQPIVNLDTKKTIGFESFLRWQHPDQGLIAPLEFMADLERTGWLIPVGWWVIREVCQQLNAWESQFSDKPIEISVNLSVQQFFHPDLIPQITALIQEYKIRLGSLSMDIPDNVIKDDPEAATEVISQLKTLGIRLNLDKLGSSSSFLTDLPHLRRYYAQFDSLKLHQTLIEEGSSTVLQVISQAAHALNINLIAVGIETLAQTDKLKSLNCKYAQGYLFSTPIS